MKYDRHYKWEIIVACLDDIVGHLGSSIYDNRCGKSWDVGQAVCAEAYGPDWQNNPIFTEWDSRDDSEPPEPTYFECALKMAKGYIPEWTQEADK